MMHELSLWLEFLRTFKIRSDLSANTLQENHPDKHAVFDLPEVGCTRVAIHLEGNFTNPRQRVEND